MSRIRCAGWPRKEACGSWRECRACPACDPRSMPREPATGVLGNVDYGSCCTRCACARSGRTARRARRRRQSDTARSRSSRAGASSTAKDGGSPTLLDRGHHAPVRHRQRKTAAVRHCSIAVITRRCVIDSERPTWSRYVSPQRRNTAADDPRRGGGQGSAGSRRDAVSEAARDRARVVAGAPTPALALPGARPGHPITSRAVDRACRKAHRRCGIPTSIPPRSLRHAFADLLEAGTDPDVTFLDDLVVEPDAVYLMDRGYLDFARLHRFTDEAAFFVTRTTRGIRLRRRTSRPVDFATGLLSDHTMGLATRDAGPRTSTSRAGKSNSSSSGSNNIFGSRRSLAQVRTP
jgi:hypothetical protein